MPYLSLNYLWSKKTPVQYTEEEQTFLSWIFMLGCRFIKTFRNPKIWLQKKEFLNVKIKRSLDVNKMFTQRYFVSWDVDYDDNEPKHVIFQQCGILTSVDSDEPAQPPASSFQSLTVLGENEFL